MGDGEPERRRSPEVNHQLELDPLFPPSRTAAWLRSIWSRASFSDANVGDPVTRSASKTRFDILAFEVSSGSAKPRLVDVFEHVDVDDCIEMVRYFAGNQRHGPALRADVKRGSPSSEGVL